MINRLENLQNQYLFANKNISHIAIEDPLLEKFSRATRHLTLAMREWIELSNDWDETLSNLRRADWRLRNQPAHFDGSHPAKLLLQISLKSLESLFKNLDQEIREVCKVILDSGTSIINQTDLSLNKELCNLISSLENEVDKRTIIIVKQQDLIDPCLHMISKMTSNQISVNTGYKYVQDSFIYDKIVVVGNSLDFSKSLFTSRFAKHGTTLLSYSWVPEVDEIRTDLSSLAVKPFIIPVVHNVIRNENIIEDAEHFIEPTREINARKLAGVANRALKSIQKVEDDEETLQCKAYLLAGNQLVFLPIKEGSIDSIDLRAKQGSRVQRMPISQVDVGSVILLRVGKSESDAIFEMANYLGGQQALSYRELQRNWKTALQLKVKELGLQKVIQQLQDRGIKRPWVNEWKHFKNNIRPESDTNFSILLDYLGIEASQTFNAMNEIRHLHQLAAMRFRKLLKDKFEQIDSAELQSNGFAVVDLGDGAEVAKLGAFTCLSVGNQIFDVPESAVKQLRKTD